MPKKFEDPPSPEPRHIRFGTNSPELVQSLEKNPRCRIGVEHAKGRKGSETPHIHLWYEPDATVTHMTIKNHLRASAEIFKSFKGQQDWSFRPHDSFETWLKYVMRNPTARVLFNKTDKDPLEFKPPIEIVDELMGTTKPDPLSGAKEVTYKLYQIPQKKLTMKDKFINHLVALEWKIEEQNPTPREVCEQLWHYWKGGFTLPEGERLVRHALYVFSDPEKQQIHFDRLYGQFRTKFNL